MFDIYFRVGNAKANDGDTTGGKLDGCHYPAAARLRAVHGGEVTLEQTYPWATAAPGVVTLRSMLGKEAEDDDVWVRIWDGWKRDFIFANSGGAYVEGRNTVPGVGVVRRPLRPRDRERPGAFPEQHDDGKRRFLRHHDFDGDRHAGAGPGALRVHGAGREGVAGSD